MSKLLYSYVMRCSNSLKKVWERNQIYQKIPLSLVLFIICFTIVYGLFKSTGIEKLAVEVQYGRLLLSWEDCTQMCSPALCLPSPWHSSSESTDHLWTRGPVKILFEWGKFIRSFFIDKLKFKRKVNTDL